LIDAPIRILLADVVGMNCQAGAKRLTAIPTTRQSRNRT